MLSSTSNSDGGLPDAPVGRVWLMALVSFALLLGTIEVMARAYGYNPMVRDSMELWCKHRDRVTKSGEDSLVLLGASRMETGIVPEELSRLKPEKEVVMLALIGRKSMATFESLANDEKFTGTVVSSIFIPGLVTKIFSGTQTSYIEFYEKEWSYRLRLSTDIHILMGGNLAILHKGLSFKFLRRRLSGIPYYKFEFRRVSRFLELHWAKKGDHILLEKEGVYRQFRDSFEETPFPSPERMVHHYSEIEQSVQKMIRRGCRVVFVRLPSSGKVWKLDQQYAPKRLYWDRFAQQTAAETYHFKDYPSLNGFECPDYSHLDYADAVRFTQALAELLFESGGVVESQPSS